MCVSLSICNFVLVSDRQWLPSIDNQKLCLGSFYQHNSPFAGRSVDCNHDRSHETTLPRSEIMELKDLAAWAGGLSIRNFSRIIAQSNQPVRLVLLLKFKSRPWFHFFRRKKMNRHLGRPMLRETRQRVERERGCGNDNWSTILVISGSGLIMGSLKDQKRLSHRHGVLAFTAVLSVTKVATPRSNTYN